MPIFRRKPAEPEIELTNAAYARWLRAQRPPFSWFLRLGELEQEALALLGDEHAQDMAVATAWAIRDPQAASLGAGAQTGDPEAEEAIAQRIAERMLSKPAQPVAAARATMAGFGAARNHIVAKDRKPARMFGQQPDEVAT